MKVKEFLSKVFFDEKKPIKRIPLILINLGISSCQNNYLGILKPKKGYLKVDCCVAG